MFRLVRSAADKHTRLDASTIPKPRQEAGETYPVVTVQHLVGEDDSGIKTADLASDVEAGGLESIGGVTDIEATFKIEVE